MDYRIVIMERAEEDLDRFAAYLLFEKKNEQAARNLPDEFEKKFLSHQYFMLYRIEGNIVFVDNIFHELQDYEDAMS